MYNFYIRAANTTQKINRRGIIAIIVNNNNTVRYISAFSYAFNALPGIFNLVEYRNNYIANHNISG